MKMISTAAAITGCGLCHVSHLMTSRLHSHAEHELEVFHEFARAAGLRLDSESARVCNPPEPVILAQVAGQARYFELGRLADSGFAAFMLEVDRRAPQPITPQYGKFGYPQRDMLIQKLSKVYESFGRPIDLLLYFDNDAPHLTGPIPPHPFEYEAQHVMEPIVRQSMGPFQAIWYFERYRHQVLWRFPCASDG
jgi:hypothetical protein